jgi:hypothetical protein
LSSSTIEDVKRLAQLIRDKKRKNENFVLFLGAGASVESGSAPWEGIINDFIKKYYPSLIQAGHDDKVDKFNEEIGKWTPKERRLILMDYIEGTGPSIGYLLLADLIRKGFFSLILTTNWDHHLEDALISRHFRTHEFLVLINQGNREMEDGIQKQLEYKEPTIKILKIYGDLRNGIIAITPRERIRFSRAVENVLRKYLTEQLIIIGSRVEDPFIIKYIAEEGERLWYVNLHPPKSRLLLDAIDARNSRGNIISGSFGDFNMFFSTLAQELMVPMEEAIKISKSPIIVCPEILRQYRRGRRSILFIDKSGQQSYITCNIIDSIPTDIKDVGKYSKLRVHINMHCPKGDESIEHHFIVGLNDKFSGIEFVQCIKNLHTFILSKRLTWLNEI